MSSVEVEGIPMRLKYAPEIPPSHKINDVIEQLTMVFNVTFVDDEAFAVTAAVPTTLTRMFIRTITLLAEAF